MKVRRNKASRIRSAIRKGLTTAEIVQKLGVSQAYVYGIRSEMKQKASADELLNKTEESPFEDSPVEITPNEEQVGGDHYVSKGIQPWDAIHDWRLGFFSGNVVKYVARHKEKGGVEDLKKARHYLDKLILIMEGELA